MSNLNWLICFVILRSLAIWHCVLNFKCWWLDLMRCSNRHWYVLLSFLRGNSWHFLSGSSGVYREQSISRILNELFIQKVLQRISSWISAITFWITVHALRMMTFAFSQWFHESLLNLLSAYRFSRHFFPLKVIFDLVFWYVRQNLLVKPLIILLFLWPLSLWASNMLSQNLSLIEVVSGVLRKLLFEKLLIRVFLKIELRRSGNKVWKQSLCDKSLISSFIAPRWTYTFHKLIHKRVLWTSVPSFWRIIRRLMCSCSLLHVFISIRGMLSLELLRFSIWNQSFKYLNRLLRSLYWVILRCWRNAIEVLCEFISDFSKWTIVNCVVQWNIVLMFDYVSPRPLLLGLHLIKEIK